MSDYGWGSKYGQETGRVFINDDLNTKLVNTVPDHDEWHLWEEFKDEDGSLTYITDDYVLDEEEFGPIEPGIAGRIIADREETDYCEANTMGCCIDHRYDQGSCETW